MQPHQLAQPRNFLITESSLEQNVDSTGTFQ